MNPEDRDTSENILHHRNRHVHGRNWMSRTFVTSALLGMALLTSLPGTASAQSTIAGLVSDTTKAVLPGVTVEASSPALIEKARTAVTNADGRYTIIDLRPGVYDVTFTLPGFRTVRRQGVEVAANVAVPLNAELQLGAVEETVTVSGETPVVDIQQAARQQVLTREVLDALPTSRTYGAAGAIVPGMKLTKPDMGGISSFSQAYIQARGKGAEQNVFEVDGLDARIIRGCVTTNYTNFGMVQEVTVQTNANSAESSGGGVRINMIPREGGNRFNGDVFVGGMNHAWQSSNITPELKARGLPTPDATRHMLEVNPAFGGPLLRDRLWFFGSYRLLRLQQQPAGAHYFADGAPGFNNTTTDSGSVRVTTQVSQRNKFTFYLDRTWKGESHRNSGILGPTAEYGPGGIDWATGTTIWPIGLYYYGYGKWTATVSPKFLVESGFLMNAQDTGYNQPQAGVQKAAGTPEWYAGASRLDIVRGQLWSHPGTTGRGDSVQPAHVFSSSATYATGSHTFKTGVQWRWGRSEIITETGNAGLQQRYRNGLPDAVDIAAVPSVTESILDADLGVYVQDSWTFRRLTVSPGVRFEYFTGGIGATEMEEGRFVPARKVTAFKPVPDFVDIAPRFSAAYDLFGNARTALKVSAGKYMSSLGVIVFNPYNPISSGVDRRNWFDTDLIAGTATPSGRSLPTNGDDIAQENEIGPTSNTRFGFAPARRADPNLEREYNWDYSVSIQHELMPRVSIVGAWYHTRFYNLQALRNSLVGIADYTPFQVSNPLNNGEMITVFNLNRDKLGAVDNVQVNSTVNQRAYNGLEGSIQARLPTGGVILGGWFAERLVSNTCDTNDPNGFRFCDESGGSYQEFGQVPGLPFRHEYKLGITHPLMWKLRGALSFQSYPGHGSHLLTNWAVPATLFPGGRTAPVTVNLIAPGTEYLKRWNQLDINLKRPLQLGRFEVQASLDVFNLLNSSVVLSEFRSFGPALGFPTGTLQGRFLKLSALIKF
jgi:hypothetical protein